MSLQSVLLLVSTADHLLITLINTAATHFSIFSVHQHLLFNTAKSSRSAKYAAAAILINTGDTSEGCHHHHHKTSRQGLEHHRLCIIVCIIIRKYASKHHHHHSLWHTMSSLPWLCITVSIHCISHNAELYIASYQHHATISVTICIFNLHIKLM